LVVSGGTVCILLDEDLGNFDALRSTSEGDGAELGIRVTNVIPNRSNINTASRDGTDFVNDLPTFPDDGTNGSVGNRKSEGVGLFGENGLLGIHNSGLRDSISIGVGVVTKPGTWAGTWVSHGLLLLGTVSSGVDGVAGGGRMVMDEANEDNKGCPNGVNVSVNGNSTNVVDLLANRNGGSRVFSQLLDNFTTLSDDGTSCVICDNDLEREVVISCFQLKGINVTDLANVGEDQIHSLVNCLQISPNGDISVFTRLSIGNDDTSSGLVTDGLDNLTRFTNDGANYVLGDLKTESHDDATILGQRHVDLLLGDLGNEIAGVFHFKVGNGIGPREEDRGKRTEERKRKEKMKGRERTRERTRERKGEEGRAGRE